MKEKKGIGAFPDIQKSEIITEKKKCEIILNITNAPWCTVLLTIFHPTSESKKNDRLSASSGLHGIILTNI